jgi:hypothetical protein
LQKGEKYFPHRFYGLILEDQGLKNLLQNNPTIAGTL